jgi:Protein of unknown function (DUF3562)
MTPTDASEVVQTIATETNTSSDTVSKLYADTWAEFAERQACSRDNQGRSEAASLDGDRWQPWGKFASAASAVHWPSGFISCEKFRK